MDLLLILTYTAICIVIFKVFKIPLNKWSVPTAALGGIVLIGTLIVVMNYNHPFSERGREYYVTTPVIPMVTGTVVEHRVRPNQMMAKGDVLFKMDPEPFQNKVDSLAAKLEAAELELKRATQLYKKHAGSKQDLDRANARFEGLQAEHEQAEFELEHSVVRAPTDGFVTQDFLRPGMRATSMPLRPVMVFVHKEEMIYTAWFRQNSMLRLEAGFEAEVALDGIPGTVFTGVVEGVLPALSEGQMQASGTLLTASNSDQPGRIAVRIKITDPRFEAYRLKVPGGAYGQAAVYSQHFHHVAIMRRILLRMSSWMNYLFPFH